MLRLLLPQIPFLDVRSLAVTQKAVQNTDILRDVPLAKGPGETGRRSVKRWPYPGRGYGKKSDENHRVG
jgi:hypothetical protein